MERLPSSSPRQPAPARTPADDDATFRLTSAMFSPVVASLNEYEVVFITLGFNDFVDVSIRGSQGFIRFSSAARVDLFVEKVNGFLFKSQPIRCQKSRQPSGGTKKIRVTWPEGASVSDRALYDEICPLAFIRKIVGKGSFAIVEFDTVGEADALISQFLKRKEWVIGKVPVRMNYIRTPRDDSLKKLTVQLSDIVPRDLKVWAMLQQQLGCAQRHG